MCKNNLHFGKLVEREKTRNCRGDCNLCGNTICVERGGVIRYKRRTAKYKILTKEVNYEED